jgi:hypothetical protein
VGGRDGEEGDARLCGADAGAAGPAVRGRARAGVGRARDGRRQVAASRRRTYDGAPRPEGGLRPRRSLPPSPSLSGPDGARARDGHQEQLALKQHEIDELLAERERCANELQKLKDILQLAASPEEYASRRPGAARPKPESSARSDAARGDEPIRSSRKCVRVSKRRATPASRVAPALTRGERRRYRSRRSYVPDAGPLYDTVKGVQASIQKRLAAIASAPPTVAPRAPAPLHGVRRAARAADIVRCTVLARRARWCRKASCAASSSRRARQISEESEAEVAESKRLLGTAEAARSELLGQVEALRSEAEDARAQVQQLRAVHEAEKKELQEYYHKTMGEMNVNQKREVPARLYLNS